MLTLLKNNIIKHKINEHLNDLVYIYTVYIHIYKFLQYLKCLEK